MKRQSDDSTLSLLPAIKKARTDVVLYNEKTDIIEMKERRTSELQSPVMMLTGHEAAVLSMRFSPDGKHLASSSHDMKIFLWDVYGDCMNFDVLIGHKNAVVQVDWSTDGQTLYSASADKTLGFWDFITGKRTKVCRGHQSFVNSVNPARRGPHIVCSSSDDGTVKIWDARGKQAVSTLSDDFQVLASCFNDSADKIFSSGIDSTIKCWDMRKEEVLYSMEGHTEAVTGIRLSADGNHLISNSRDGTLRSWDVRPFVPGDSRCVKIFRGHQHNFENNLLKCSISNSGTRVSCGNADRTVNIWDYDSQMLKYRLPGHKGAVYEVDFHPNEPIVGSAGADKIIYLGEIDEELQQDEDVDEMRNNGGFKSPKKQMKGRWKTNYEWVKDRDPAGQQCFQCRTQFGLNRLVGGMPRHHCRKCGNIFCSSCANHYVLHPATHKQVRVCNECFVTVGSIPSRQAGATLESLMQRFRANSPDAGGYTSDHDNDMLMKLDIDENEKPLPLWIYLLYPFVTNQNSQGYGRLTINVIEAKDLIPSDFNLFQAGTSDPYVKIHFGTTFKAKHKTKVIYKSLNPRWNESFSFVVNYPESMIDISVYDRDTVSEDDFLGKVSLPLSLFMDGKLHDAWFFLQPDDPEKARKEPGSYDAATFQALGAIRLQIKLLHSKAGHIFAHFREKEWDPDNGSVFHVNTFYANYMKLSDALINPILVFIVQYLLEIMFWTKPWWSAVMFAFFCFLCMHTDYIPAASHLPWLFYMIKGFIRSMYKGFQDLPLLDRQITEENISQMSKQETKQLNKEISSKQSSGEQNIENNLGSIAPLINIIIATLNLGETVKWYQSLFDTLASSVNMLWYVTDWENYQLSMGFSFFVFLSAIWHLFMPYALTMFIIGLLLFFVCTSPFLVFIRYISGSISIFSFKYAKYEELKSKYEILETFTDLKNKKKLKPQVKKILKQIKRSSVNNVIEEKNFD